MAPNLPTYFIEDVRLEIVDQTTYSDNEIYAFARKSINRVCPLIEVDPIVADGTSVWDYTVTSTMDDDFWEIIKWSTISDILNHYKNKMIAEGVGVSVGLGSERIDTKSLLLTAKDMVGGAKKVLNEKILAYNMSHKNGSMVDLYYRGKTW
jgi:hypothetical protein